MAGSTGSYERDVDTLERELGIIEDTFRGLSDEDWGTRTLLQPIDPELPRWLADGSGFLPSDDTVKRLRPAE